MHAAEFCRHKVPGTWLTAQIRQNRRHPFFVRIDVNTLIEAQLLQLPLNSGYKEDLSLISLALSCTMDNGASLWPTTACGVGGRLRAGHIKVAGTSTILSSPQKSICPNLYRPLCCCILLRPRQAQSFMPSRLELHSPSRGTVARLIEEVSKWHPVLRGGGI